MKNLMLMMSVIILSTGIANAFPETSSFNTAEMQRIQNLQYNTRNDYDNIDNFKERKQLREEKAKQIQERQKQMEERVANPISSRSQFINENGVIKIQNQ